MQLAGLIRLTAQAGDAAQANSLEQADLPTPFTSNFASLQYGRGGQNIGSVTEMTFNLVGTGYTNSVNAIIPAPRRGHADRATTVAAGRPMSIRC